jgi:hypothetical protein
MCSNGPDICSNGLLCCWAAAAMVPGIGMGLLQARLWRSVIFHLRLIQLCEAPVVLFNSTMPVTGFVYVLLRLKDGVNHLRIWVTSLSSSWTVRVPTLKKFKVEFHLFKVEYIFTSGFPLQWLRNTSEDFVVFFTPSKINILLNGHNFPLINIMRRKAMETHGKNIVVCDSRPRFHACDTLNYC